MFYLRKLHYIRLIAGHLKHHKAIIYRSLMEIKISHDEPLVDEKLRISIKGLQPDQRVTVKSSVTEGRASFSSSACFLSDSDGNVHIDRQPSLEGSYTGVDCMGLFWSMVQDPGQQKGSRHIKHDVTTPETIKLSVFDGTISWNDCHNLTVEPVISTEFQRWYLHKNVQRKEIRQGNLRGTLFTPSGPGPFPGVIDMFGTAGGLIEFRASMLASRGFITYALPYFNHDDLPKDFRKINFDYLKESVEWFSGLPKVIQSGIGIIGVSKGGEIALMLATQCSQVKSVVNINGTPFCSYSPIGPYTDFVDADASRYKFDQEGLHIRNGLDVNIKPRHILKMWKSNVQVLYIVGEEDQSVNPEYAQMLYQSYPEDQRHKLEIKRYPKAGHLIEPCYLPFCRASYHKVFGFVFVWGGQMEDHAKAQEDSWISIQNFFNTTLASKHYKPLTPSQL